jgi:hypothetical protein
VRFQWFISFQRFFPNRASDTLQFEQRKGKGDMYDQLLPA